jgi:hypothetical protein
MGVTRKSAVNKAPRKKKVAPAKRTPSTTAAKVKKARTKKLRLTLEEKRLLEYPPTKKTWKCECDTINSGSMAKCWTCAKPKTKKLMWPIYTAACEKVLITPGDQWKIIDSRANFAKVKREGTGKWVEHPLPEGYSLP